MRKIIKTAEAASADESAEPTEVTETAGGEPATGDATDTLGDAGKKALAAERAARKEAEKRASDLAAQIKAAEDAGKTEAQKQADALAALQADLAAMRAEKERAEVAAKTGVPVDILAGPGDDPTMWAEQVKAWASEQAKPAEAPAQPVVRHHGNPSGAGAASLDEQIAAAEAAGDRTLTASLKALKLGSR
jgi:hypothetical protein